MMSWLLSPQRSHQTASGKTVGGRLSKIYITTTTRDRRFYLSIDSQDVTDPLIIENIFIGIRRVFRKKILSTKTARNEHLVTRALGRNVPRVDQISSE